MRRLVGNKYSFKEELDLGLICGKIHPIKIICVIYTQTISVWTLVKNLYRFKGSLPWTTNNTKDYYIPVMDYLIFKCKIN